MPELVGIGDAHFDKLDSIIPDATPKITRCWRKVFKYAQDRAIPDVIFYGDIGEKHRLSDGAQCAILDTVLREEYSDLRLHFILGNHDFSEDGQHSLTWLEVIAKRLNKNFRVYTKQELIKIQGVPFNMLPYPFEETLKDHINVGHFEVKGSVRDNGKSIDEGPSSKHTTLMGHLHTKHRVRNTYFSGTLYQTNFGESMPKSFHHVKFDSAKDYEVNDIAFKPPWELRNSMVSSMDDVKALAKESHILHKLFVKDGADVDINYVLQNYPNVVRHKAFKSKADLKQQIEEAWDFESGLTDEIVNPINDKDVIADWMRKDGHKSKQIRRGFEILDRLQA